MNVVGLFAGIGGFELAFEREGFTPLLLCENNPAALAVLKKNFPSVPVIEDIRSIKELPKKTDIVCAGFPCQNLSSSGDKEGIKGNQSSLVDEVFRLLKKQKVQWVIIENVKFMLHLQKGMAIRHVIQSLEKLGYRWAYRVVNSQLFGVPQRRERVFIVASLDGDPASVLFSDHSLENVISSPLITRPVGFYWTEGKFSTGLAANALPPLKGGSTIGIPSSPAILFPDGRVATPDIRDAERLQGFPVDWTDIDLGSAKQAFRWKLVGNAVTVNVTQWLSRQLKNTKPVELSQDVMIDSYWPVAGWGSKKEGKFHATIGAGPSTPQIEGLDEFLHFDPKPLSFKAISGFIGRARSGNLKYPDGFLDNLDKYAASMRG